MGFKYVTAETLIFRLMPLEEHLVFRTGPPLGMHRSALELGESLHESTVLIREEAGTFSQCELGDVDGGALPTDIGEDLTKRRAKSRHRYRKERRKVKRHLQRSWGPVWEMVEVYKKVITEGISTHGDRTEVNRASTSQGTMDAHQVRV